jgi:hypothetical protein
MFAMYKSMLMTEVGQMLDNKLAPLAKQMQRLDSRLELMTQQQQQLAAHQQLAVQHQHQQFQHHQQELREIKELFSFVLPACNLQQQRHQHQHHQQQPQEQLQHALEEEEWRTAEGISAPEIQKSSDLEAVEKDARLHEVCDLAALTGAMGSEQTSSSTCLPSNVPSLLRALNNNDEIAKRSNDMRSETDEIMDLSDFSVEIVPRSALQKPASTATATATATDKEDPPPSSSLLSNTEDVAVEEGGEGEEDREADEGLRGDLRLLMGFLRDSQTAGADSAVTHALASLLPPVEQAAVVPPLQQQQPAGGGGGGR